MFKENNIFLLLIILFNSYGCTTVEPESRYNPKEWSFLGFEGKKILTWANSNNYIYTGTEEVGLWRLNINDSNSNWIYLGFSPLDTNAINGNGISDILVFERSPDRVLVTTGNESSSSQSHFVYRSDDDGVHWVTADSGLVYINGGGNEIGRRIYLLEQIGDYIIGAGESSGIYKTNNFGEYWEPIDTTVLVRGRVLEAHPSHQHVVWYGGNSPAWTTMLYVSINGGISWNRVNPYPVLGGDSPVDFIGFIPELPNYVKVHTWSELVESHDLGVTWDTLTVKSLENIVYDPENVSKMYATMWDTLFVSGDGGSSWDVIESPNETAIQSLYFIDDENGLYLSTEVGVYKWQ